jgi:four helix bundle protein
MGTVPLTQIRSAAISVMNNIAEGLGRRGDKEFLMFLRIAKGSITEIQSMSYVGLDAEYFDEQTQGRLLAAAVETAIVVNGLQTYLKGKAGR